MRYDTIVEITPEGRAALRLVIIPDDPADSVDRNGEPVVVIPAEEPEEERGVVTWQM
jgi:hypothetical protein